MVSDGRIERNYLKVLAEFGVDVKDDKTTQQESKKKKKKAKDDTSKNDAPELSEVSLNEETILILRKSPLNCTDPANEEP